MVEAYKEPDSGDWVIRANNRVVHRLTMLEILESPWPEWSESRFRAVFRSYCLKERDDA